MLNSEIFSRKYRESPYGRVGKLLDYDTLQTEFELYSQHYIPFQIDTIEKD